MKKFLAILLAMLMCFGMVACANDAPDTTEPDTSIETTVPETSDPVEEETAVEEVVFNPVTLVDSDHLVFRVTSEPYRDEFWDGYSVDTYAENPTDKTIYVALLETSVNGYMIDPYYTVEIAAGKKINETFTFMKDDLDKNGITESIDNISFKVAIYDADWNEIWCSEPLSMDFE